jgi:hypothetical protein
MRSPEERWYSAYEAWKRAKNTAFKEYWAGIMDHFRKEFS